MAETTTQSPFLRLPLEIRLIIYEYLLFPSAHPNSSHCSSVMNLLPDYHTYCSSDTNPDPFTLTVRTIDPYLGPRTSRGWRRRSTYHVRTGPFLTSTVPTTYRILLSPYTSHLRHTVPSLLPLSHQIHEEASKVLYSAYTFSFHANIESAVPFFSDLTPISRSHIRHVQFTKKALPYTKEFDRAEWSSLCAYVAQNLCLRTLQLGIIAGRPGEEGWESIAAIGKEGFEVLNKMQKDWGQGTGSWGNSIGGVDLEWVEQLMAIRGLRKLRVKAMVEHCPPPRSDGMRFWVSFSKSVEVGFAEWVRSVMVGDCLVGASRCLVGEVGGPEQKQVLV